MCVLIIAKQPWVQTMFQIYVHVAFVFKLQAI